MHHTQLTLHIRRRQSSVGFYLQKTKAVFISLAKESFLQICKTVFFAVKFTITSSVFLQSEQKHLISQHFKHDS